MQINWKLRLKNKTTLIALATAAVAFVYQILAIFGVVPTVSQDAIMNIITLLITLLAGLGIVVDPTTQGLTDSNQAMKYEEPAVDKKED